MERIYFHQATIWIIQQLDSLNIWVINSHIPLLVYLTCSPNIPTTDQGIFPLPLSHAALLQVLVLTQRRQQFKSTIWKEKQNLRTKYHLQFDPLNLQCPTLTSGGNHEAISLGNTCGHIREWRFWGAVSVDLPRVSNAWPAWLSSLIK